MAGMTLGALVLASATLPAQAARDGHPALVGFHQDPQSITIELDRVVRPLRYVRLPDVPEHLDLDALRRSAVPVRADGNDKDNDATIPLAGEPTQGEYSVVVFAGRDYVELVRQSSAWLQRSFAFQRPGGYTILGRRSIGVGKGQVPSYRPLQLVGQPRSVHVRPAAVSAYREINLAAGLLASMVKQGYRQGPTSKSYDEFLHQSYEEKIRRVRSGEFAVMCSGFRDLFAHAASAVPGLKVRLVEAFNYEPQLPDLIPYGHSTTEIWVARLHRWVLFDPWMGVVVTRKGVPIGARELQSARNLDAVALLPIVPAIPRMYEGQSGKVTRWEFHPASTQLSAFTCTSLGCAPGYADYFRAFHVRSVEIERAPHHKARN